MLHSDSLSVFLFETVRASVRHTDAPSGLPRVLSWLGRLSCRNTGSHLNGRHPRPVNAYLCLKVMLARKSWALATLLVQLRQRRMPTNPTAPCGAGCGKGVGQQGWIARFSQGIRWFESSQENRSGDSLGPGFGPLGSIQNHRVMPAAFLYHFSQRQSGRAGRLGQDRIESIRIVLAQIRRGPEPQVLIA